MIFFHYAATELFYKWIPYSSRKSWIIAPSSQANNNYLSSLKRHFRRNLSKDACHEFRKYIKLIEIGTCFQNKDHLTPKHNFAQDGSRFTFSSPFSYISFHILHVPVHFILSLLSFLSCCHRATYFIFTGLPYRIFILYLLWFLCHFIAILATRCFEQPNHRIQLILRIAYNFE